MESRYIMGIENSLDINKNNLLSLIKVSLMNNPLNNNNLNDINIGLIMQMAKEHEVMDIIIDEIISLRDNCKEKSSEIDAVQIKTLKKSYVYLTRQSNILKILNGLGGLGVPVIMLKGLILSDCYPKPQYRMSGDTDIFVSDEYQEKALLFFRENGFSVDYELGSHHYCCRRLDMGLIELHKSLFGSTSIDNLFGEENVNSLMEEQFAEVEIYGYKVKTLGYTSNLCFIIMHAAKHFIYGGTNLRQLLDILLFAKKYKERIGWYRVWEIFDKMKLLQWVACVFEIGRKYFDIDLTDADGYKKMESGDNMIGFLNHIFDSVNRANDLSNREYTRYLTSSSDKKQMKVLYNNPICFYVKVLFPGTSGLHDNRYRYARKHKLLLPVAWVHRMFQNLFFRGNIAKIVNEGKDTREKFMNDVTLFRKLKIFD